jgi:hypothetical protein
MPIILIGLGCIESILQDVLKLINDAMGYLRLFVIGGTAFFVAKD